MKLLLHTMTRLLDRCNHDKFVILRFLAMAELTEWCVYMLDKQTFEIDTTSRKRDRS